MNVTGLGKYEDMNDNDKSTSSIFNLQYSMAASKVVLITGSNSGMRNVVYPCTILTPVGIGYEALKVFLNATKPYHILAAARTHDKASQAVDRAKTECPGSKNTIEPITIDVTSDQSIEQAFEQVSKSPGHLDALINNAGK